MYKKLMNLSSVTKNTKELYAGNNWNNKVISVMDNVLIWDFSSDIFIDVTLVTISLMINHKLMINNFVIMTY